MTEIPGNHGIDNNSARRVLRQGLVISAGLLLLVLMVLPVKYIVNDDPTFAAMLSGADGFGATGDVPFLSRVLSQGLRTLYGVVPGVPWYGICLYLSAWLGLALWVSVAVVMRANPPVCLALTVACIPYMLFGLYNISMTEVTLWLELGVFLHVFCWLRAGRSFRLSPEILLGALVLGYLWRWEMFLVFLAFAFPLLVVIVRADTRRCVPWVLVLLAVVVVDRGWETAVTRSREHQQYDRFNRARGYFHDRVEGQRNQETSQALSAVGWSENDYAAFQDIWMLYDGEVLTEASLRKFVERNSRSSAQPGLLARASQVLRGNRLYLPPFMLGMASLLVLSGRAGRRLQRGERVRLGVMLVMTAGMVAAVGFVRFVPRVSFPLMIYWLGLLALVAPVGARSVTARCWKTWAGANWWVIVVVVVSAGFWAYWLRIDVSGMRSEAVQRSFVQQGLREFIQERQGTRVLVPLEPGVSLVHVGAGPLAERLPLGDVGLLPAGWAVRSPRYGQALERLGCNSGREWLRSVVNDPSVYFVRYLRPWDKRGAVESIWQGYFAEHLGGGTLELEQRFEENGYELLFWRMVDSGDG